MSSKNTSKSLNEKELTAHKKKSALKKRQERKEDKNKRWDSYY